jgi:glycosyltransferase involved in cell wall biosynthesis
LTPEAQVEVIENGIDCAHYVPRREAHPEPPRLLFTGTSVPRNMTALHGFVRHVLPLIRAELPAVELLVGGNFEVAAQREFAGFTNVHFTGRVEDIRPVFDQSDVFVAPFEETHGSKLKIAEAMAMAIPIVSTPQGIRGFPLVEGQSVLIGRTAIELAEKAIVLLRNSEQRKAMGNAARQVALRTIDWRVLGERLRAIVDDVYGKIRNDR